METFDELKNKYEELFKNNEELKAAKLFTEEKLAEVENQKNEILKNFGSLKAIQSIEGLLKDIEELQRSQLVINRFMSFAY